MKSFISCERDVYKHKGEDSNMAIIIDGIIGAGKTTVGRFMSKTFGISFFEELKNESKNTLEQRMLDRFYDNQSRWSAIIQVMFLSERFRDIKRAESSEIHSIFDRSIYGDEIFAKTIHDRGQMTDDEFAIYESLLENMLEHVSPPELLIYIDVTVDTAIKRINKRARSTEADSIPKDYMEDLRYNYELWYDSFQLCPKIKIDFNETMVDDNGNLSEEIQKIIIRKVMEQTNLKPL